MKKILLMLMMAIVSLTMISGCNVTMENGSTVITVAKDDTKTISIYADRYCKSLTYQGDVTDESPIWYIGESMSTAENIFSDGYSVVDSFGETGGWGLESGDNLLFSESDNSYDNSRVNRIVWATPSPLFGEYTLGCVKFRDMKPVFGASEIGTVYVYKLIPLISAYMKVEESDTVYEIVLQGFKDCSREQSSYVDLENVICSKVSIFRA